MTTWIPLEHNITGMSSAPLACRTKWLNETAKTEALCHSRRGTIKVPHWSKVLRTKQNNFVALSRQWWRIHMREIFSIGQWIINNQTKKQKTVKYEWSPHLDCQWWVSSRPFWQLPVFCCRMGCWALSRPRAGTSGRCCVVWTSVDWVTYLHCKV